MVCMTDRDGNPEKHHYKTKDFVWKAKIFSKGDFSEDRVLKNFYGVVADYLVKTKQKVLSKSKANMVHSLFN